jgi:hypothetical protein
MAVTVGEHLRGGKEVVSAMPSTTPDPLPEAPVLAVVCPEAHEDSEPTEPLDSSHELADLIRSQARDMAGEGLSMRPSKIFTRECDMAPKGEAAGFRLDNTPDDRAPLRFAFLDPPSASGLWAGGAGGGGGAGGASSNPTPSTVKPTARASTTKPSTARPPTARPPKPTACPVCGGHPEHAGRRAYCLRCDLAASDGRVVYGGLDVGAALNPGWGATNPTRYAPPERVDAPEGKGQVGQASKVGGKARTKGSTKPLRGGLG